VKRYLLDTHTFIWWIEDSPRLSDSVREIIGDSENECWFSLVSAWEMAIKISLERLKLAIPLKRYIPEHSAANNFNVLAIDFRHITKVAHLSSLVFSLSTDPHLSLCCLMGCGRVDGFHFAA
jgi:PIN domain nuclease of toxin-antitoxin system